MSREPAPKGDCPICGNTRVVCRRNYRRREARWNALSPAEKRKRLERMRNAEPEAHWGGNGI